ncbi:MAG: orotate phosphoribosyltransferase [Candidatus Hydrogenedentes bacterium]|nr:orotate phosphoribosyltransferase [Candidatus Hydrogenedentota bacterium]
MTDQEVIEVFRQAGALLEGHFIYASGRHGSKFLQAARVLQFPEHTERLCRALAQRFLQDSVELVVGPATGGIILAYETARHLHCRAAFSEKEEGGGMAVKRGFAIRPGLRALVVEDIITTGGSVQKTIDHLRGRGVEIVGVGALIDRSGGAATFDCRFEALAQLHLESYPPDQVPADLQQAPVLEPDNLVL